MKQPEHEINNVIKSALHKSTPSISFESLWDMHSNKDKAKSKYRRAALIPLIALFTLFACFTIGYAYSRLADNTDLPFVDDPEVIGSWETVDFVSHIEDFNPDKRFFNPELFHLNNLVFIKDGKLLDRYENGDLNASISTWTKGIIINEQEKTASKYMIQEINGIKYMFMEWKSGDYVFRYMKPKYYVLKKLNS